MPRKPKTENGKKINRKLPKAKKEQITKEDAWKWQENKQIIAKGQKKTNRQQTCPKSNQKWR